jgi:hypothetical protein
LNLSNLVNSRFETAIQRFEAENAKDPNCESAAGKAFPRELLYARRLTDWVLKLEPAASEELRLAACCQHIRRWEIPRSEFPLDKAGYHRWRTRLKSFHAEIAGKILRECGYDEKIISRVQELNLKKRFPDDPESRTLEDALCLVFLEYQFKDLAARTDRDKILNALRKSWGKMTENARKIALCLPFEQRERELIAEALAPSKPGDP